jgi:hypothetical protein
MNRTMKNILSALTFTCIAMCQASGTMSRPLESHERAPAARVFRRVLGKLKRETKVPILLPARLPRTVKESDIHIVQGDGKPDGYEVTLSYKPDCGDACVAGWFEAKRGDKAVMRDFDKRVRLVNGIRGFYRAKSCGMSCTPPEIDWQYKGVLYAVQFNVNGRSDGQDEAAMIALANSAISGGER